MNPTVSEEALDPVLDTGARFPPADADSVDAAVRAARDAFPAWAAVDPAGRGAVLRRFADALERHAPELAALNQTDTHRPRDEAAASVDAAVGALRQYAELGPVHRGRSQRVGWDALDVVVPRPRGVVVALTPWNDPVPVACGLLGAALVTGNTALHKPSERAQRTGALLGALAEDCLPEGVLRTLFGDGEVGTALAGHGGVDVVAHVGGTATGRSIAAAVARTGAKALLENGGNDAMVVDADVDPGWAARQAALGAFANAGQVRVSVERVYVHEAIAEAFTAALVEEARRWVAEPGEGERLLPPLVDDRHRALVHGQVQAAIASGATALTGAALPEGRLPWYPATVLTGCDPTMVVLTEETFGPVVPVLPVPDFETGLRAADDRHGLAATVLTGSMANAQRAWRELPVGTVKVNAVSGGSAHPGRAGGEGFGCGPELLDEMTATKVVHLRAPGA
ncbi:aldehyde dehydrogenase family protein [Actinokineospora pegani]|uniref:aldehyde dehydrogenase family protein n=1 Tax=Actinokineospora pegani TaxID=2654637 RepID=UPI0012EA6708